MNGFVGSPRRHAGRSGQVAVFLLMVLVILFFVVLWNFDLHKTIMVKNISQNAGDSGALIAARWQGLSLNLVGDLNLLHAIALTAGDAATADAITNIQARLLYTGPMIGFMASQQIAKNNGLFVNTAYTDAIRKHADTVRYDYPTAIGTGGAPLFPEPYPGCWDEYADMLELIADNGVALGPENAKFYSDYVNGDHILLRIDFYEAISGKTWCWFYHNAPTLPDDYENFPPCWWPPLPPISVTRPMNSEIFGLGLTRVAAPLDSLVDLEALVEPAGARGLGTAISTPVMTDVVTWYCYDPEIWAPWEAMSLEGDYPFPSLGPVKPEYDYAGADAATRSDTHTRRLSPGHRGAAISNAVTWTAAAKPFGFLNGHQVPNAYGLVLPAFHEVRLIPVDASSTPSGGGFNLEWRLHVVTHLPPYMESGPSALVPSCWYCDQLVTWENPAFRAEGSAWLVKYGHLCETAEGGGGRSAAGGRRRAH